MIPIPQINATTTVTPLGQDSSQPITTNTVQLVYSRPSGMTTTLGADMAGPSINRSPPTEMKWTPNSFGASLDGFPAVPPMEFGGFNDDPLPNLYGLIWSE